ncbi:MAG TPA: hypothetical protein VGS41_00230, partial [Chthonomonadales bacterium]|nr:hypothetical protein [Chthonomonadales bacterium]
TIIKHLPAGSAARRAAVSLIEADTDRPADLPELLKILLRPSDHDWRNRIAATWVMGRSDLSPELLRSALPVLRQTLLYRGRWNVHRGISRAALTTLLLGPVGWLALAAVFGTSDGIDLEGVLAFCTMIFPAALLWEYIRELRTRLKVRCAAAQALGRLRDAYALEPLLLALQEGSRRFRFGRRSLCDSVLGALPDVLYRVSSEHNGQVTANALRSLCKLLATPNENLSLAILSTLGHVGDSTCVATVERIALGKGPGHRQPRIKQAAQAALASIRAHITSQVHADTLLRPAVLDSYGATLRTVIPSSTELPAQELKSGSERNTADR